LDYDAVFGNGFLLFYAIRKMAQFALYRKSAASTAGHVYGTEINIRAVIGETAGSFMKGFLAEVSRTALFDDVTLYDDDVVFVLDHLFCSPENICVPH